MRTAWSAYQRALHTIPIRTKAVTSSIILFSGDALAQYIQKEGPWDYSRSLAMGAYGFAFLAPISHNWFRLLEKIFPKRQTKLGQFGNLVGKVVLDQTTISPFFIGCFFVYRGLLAGKNSDDIKKNLQDNYINIYKSSLKLWPAAQMVNFYLVPLHFRLLYINCVSLVWNTYLASKTKFNTDATVNNKV